ncbi:PilZ domain-containing protein [Ureibacillus composti]|nr:PilZ domain-containing protein [Ureibacillus composti]
MQFKRKESFRFVFNNPIDASFTIIQKEANENHEPSKFPCQILDIIPKGIKMYREGEIKERVQNNTLLDVEFVLDVTNIKATGQVMWVKPLGSGKQYGVSLPDQPDIEELIIFEMKQRRRKEVLAKTH